jgi:serine/threonine protein kinase
MNEGEALPEGYLLDDRYRVRKVLGVGRVGRAYLSEDKRMADRLVVVKEVIVRDAFQPKRALSDLRSEVRALGALSHRSIPVLTDYFVENARHYMVTEFVEGSDLQSLLDKLGPNFHVPEDQVLRWAREILEALDIMHDQNPRIMCGDLKPSNITIDQSGCAMLIDFGIKRFSPPGGPGIEVGAGNYAPPERYMGRIEPRSDLYSLAATMHHLLTGRDPRLGRLFSFPPVRSLAPEVSIRTADVVMQALEWDSAKRPASAAKMLRALVAKKAGCVECGYENLEGLDYCDGCHVRLAARPSQEARTSRYEGSIKCAECGYDNMEGLDYCDGCGARLAANASVSAIAHPADSPSLYGSGSNEHAGATVVACPVCGGEVHLADLECEFCGTPLSRQGSSSSSDGHIEELETDTGPNPLGGQTSMATSPERKKVFIVHGRDDGFRETVARFIESKLGLPVTVLQEEPSRGRALLEKFEANTDVAFAVVLMTGDDRGGTKDQLFADQMPRARQNVLFELGFFLGKLGRDRVCAIYESGVELPSDYSGIVYIQKREWQWQLQLAKELKAAGLPVNSEKLL